MYISDCFLWVQNNNLAPREKFLWVQVHPHDTRNIIRINKRKNWKKLISDLNKDSFIPYGNIYVYLGGPLYVNPALLQLKTCWAKTSFWGYHGVHQHHPNLFCILLARHKIYKSADRVIQNKINDVTKKKGNQ